MFIDINKDNIDNEHICCAFSDKKCSEGYGLKKAWLKNEFENGYKFYRLDERAKVFIEYGSSEKAWLPIEAESFININCFWVSGKYKNFGYGKKLLEKVETEAREQGKKGLITVCGKKKNNYMSDGKWLMKQGFKIVDELDTGFVLLAKIFEKSSYNIIFSDIVRKGEIENKELVIYYSNRCPFTEYYVNIELVKLSEKYGIPLKIIKLETIEEAKNCPSPATIFSAFYKGKFLTNDMSICLEKNFEKIILGEKNNGKI